MSTPIVGTSRDLVISSVIMIDGALQEKFRLMLVTCVVEFFKFVLGHDRGRSRFRLSW